MSLAVRLKHARLKKKITQEELAERVGIKQQAIQRIEAGKVKSTSYVVQLAQVLSVTPEWLALGEGDEDDVITTPEHHLPPEKSAVNDAPLLQWHDVDLLSHLPLSDDSLTYLPVFNGHYTNSFALQIKDSSMVTVDSDKTSFLKDDYIIAEATSEAKHGDFVIAKLPDSSLLCFRKLYEDALVRELRPLNNQYNSIRLTSEVRICGVVFLRYSKFNH